MSATKISWADDTINVFGGCTETGRECDRCYARGMSHRLGSRVPLYNGTTYKPEGQPVQWTGQINFDVEPLVRYRDKKGRRIFLASMSDWCHPNVTNGQIWAMWTELVRQKQHRFMLLTKRPGRIGKVLGPDGIGWYATESAVPCPEPGIELGTSVGIRKSKFRIGQLADSPAEVRFLSCEPLLEHLGTLPLDGIHQVIVGAESVGGRPGTPMDLGWVRDIRDQCVDQGVAFFFKQAFVDGVKVENPVLDGRQWVEFHSAAEVTP